MMMRNWNKLLPFAWLMFISVLFALPGSALPKKGWLNTIHFDKWVHIGLFFILLYLWRFLFPAKFNWTVVLAFGALLYGTTVELVQETYIAHRSFDVYDIAADMVGAVAGLLFWWDRYKKNRPL